jgi:hypothetical protein
MRRNARIIIVFVVTIVTANFGIAQDVITLKNGTDINALVQEVGDVEIKYKKFDNPNGPNYTLKKSEILIIRYENGTKDIFSEEAKSVEKQAVSMSESASTKNNENTETVYLPENMQNRKDVIVVFGGLGIQTRITNIDDKCIYFIKYKKNGTEKEEKIKQKYVEFTLSFNENAKQEKFPLQMSVQDFATLPIYFSGSYAKPSWIVFGTDRMSNLSQIKKMHPDIYSDYVEEGKIYKKGSNLQLAGAITFWFVPPVGVGLGLPGSIICKNGVERISGSFHTYYATCVDLKVCTKYGIIITPYNTSLTFK